MRWIAIPLLLLAGCAGQQLSPAYTLDAEAADRVLATAMASEFPGQPVSRVEFPNRGYQTMLRFGFDTHTIAAYALPASDGYSFEISHSGSMPMTGKRRATSLYERIIQEVARWKAGTSR